MANVINYHKHVRHGYSRDGYLVEFTTNVQQNSKTISEKIRPLTKKEIMKHVRERINNNKKIWFHKYVYRKFLTQSDKIKMAFKGN